MDSTSSSTSGGYDFNFVDKVSEEFVCPICLLVLKEPHLTSCCGHHFCETCVTRIKSEGRACPFCKEKSFETLIDKSVQRKVNSLQMSCPMEGCGWVESLSSYETHLQTCGYVRMSCDNGCGRKVFRLCLDIHKEKHCLLRPFSCSHCGHEATWQEIVKDHYLVCQKYPVPCPSKCGGKMARMEVDEHLATNCPLAVVPCKFSFAGCSEKMCRKDVVAHLEGNAVSHLSILADMCLKLKRDLEAKDEKISQLESMLRDVQPVPIPYVPLSASDSESANFEVRSVSSISSEDIGERESLLEPLIENRS